MHTGFSFGILELLIIFFLILGFPAVRFFLCYIQSPGDNQAPVLAEGKFGKHIQKGKVQADILVLERLGSGTDFEIKGKKIPKIADSIHERYINGVIRPDDRHIDHATLHRQHGFDIDSVSDLETDTLSGSEQLLPLPGKCIDLGCIAVDVRRIIGITVRTHGHCFFFIRIARVIVLHRDV